MDDTEDVCEGCEQATDLNDDGYCEPCQLERDIRKAENLRDAREDR